MPNLEDKPIERGLEKGNVREGLIDQRAKNIAESYRGLKDFKYFCKEILGYKADPAVGYYDLTPTHDTVMDIMQAGGLAKLILMPRESIKSQIITIGYALWELAKDPNIRILIYSDSATKAAGFLSGIKFHIEGKAANSRFREVYGAWESDPHKGGIYNESRITVSVREHESKEPSVDTCGIDQSKVGLHYDLVLYDDIVTDLNCTTKAQMDKVYDCYRKSLSLLCRGGKVVILGTRWSFGDTYGRIAKDNEDTGEFKIFIKDAMETGEDGKLLFEGIGMTREWLEEQRRKQGSYLFSALYRNNPVSDETALFKMENFSFYDQTPKFHENMYVTGTCDPAGEGDDFTAITVVGHDSKKNMYILEAINKHMGITDICKEIINLNYKYGFSRFSVEKNFFKGALEKEFRREEEPHLKNSQYRAFSFNEDIVSSKTTGKAFNRVLSLQPFHEKKMLHFPGKDFLSLRGAISELAYQLLQYTIDGCKAPHDDLIVSLAFHVDIAATGGDAKQEGPPETSAAWFEQMQIEGMQKRNRGVPMKARVFYEPVFS